MSKRLELLFTTELGTSSTIGIDNPKEPVDAQAVSEAMDDILESGVFHGANGFLTGKRGARIVDRTVETIDID
jgi:hypothetical protein